ncbi:toll/interleukin-1 receptor domain-containing protein [Kibdelosporangium aridum]|uniref:WD40 repeat n=1 Tax=Kibdelosporangium aridum TaxID=2030 RepID=A0A1W2AZT8_KIBAR|nr:TIR domain-containing protein [Kibdelosporangium aridum]SMC65698.1 WD40 repeat [Kibdelosporangium aridum]
MSKVFLSYSRNDLSKVDAIADVLDQAGVPVWIDRRDIPVSVPWFDEVRDSIMEAPLVVICESLDWYSSEACRLELLAAEEYGKHIEHVDVADQDPVFAGKQIARMYGELSAADHVHAELLGRAGAWARAGRSSRSLALGKALRRLCSVENKTGLPLTPDARDYLRASRKRHRRRRTLALFGASVLAILLPLGQSILKAKDMISEKTAAAAEVFLPTASIGLQLKWDVYGALEQASQRVFQGHTEFLTRNALMDALDVPVPDSSLVAAGRQLVGFTTGEIAADPVVMDTMGGTGSAASKPHQVSEISAGDKGEVLTAPGALCDAEHVAVSPDSQSKVGIRNRRICLSTGKHAPVTATLSSPLTSVAAAGGTVAVGDANGTVHVLNNLVEVGSTTISAGPVDRLKPSHDNQFFAAADGRTGLVHILLAKDGSVYRKISTAQVPSALAFSPDNRVLAVGVGESVELVDLTTGVVKTTLRGGVGLVRDLAWSADGAKVWAVAGDNRVTSWPWRSGRVLFDDATAWFVGLSDVDPSGRVTAFRRDGTIETIDAIDAIDPVNASVTTTRTSQQEVYNGATDSSGTNAAFGLANAVMLRDLGTGSERTVPVPNCLVSSLGFARHTPTVYGACVGGMVVAIDIRSAKVIKTIDIPRLGAQSLAVIPDTDRLLVGGYDGSVFETDSQLTNVATPHPSKNLSPVRTIVVSADGRTALALTDGTGNVGYAFAGHRGVGGDWRWDTMILSGATGTGQEIRAAALTKDGKLGAVGFADGTIEVFLPEDMSPGWHWTEMSGSIRGLQFTGDNQMLLVATRDGMINVIPSCPNCHSIQALAQTADRRVSNARTMGLFTG